MPLHERVLTFLGLAIVFAPVFPLAAFLAAFMVERPMTEGANGRLIQSSLSLGLLAALGAAAVMLLYGVEQHPIELADWLVGPRYHLKLEFVLDVLSLSYAILTYALCAVIAAFSLRYLHREPGYNRFFVLFALFLMGMVTTALSDTVEMLFAGWEMVGLSSVLLIAFFQERPAPPRNGLRVWVVYRVCDVALLLAAVLMHEINGAGDFDHLVGTQAWPHHDAVPVGQHFGLLGFLFVVAAAGKSALLPFSSWLPRAMEGPTPSSAVFYGALSVHLGAFLLLRVSPLLDGVLFLSALVAILGSATAVFAYLAGRVQTDIKSALAFSSLMQVGLIIAEIGMGFRYLALAHLLGNACLRTLQFLRAPSLMRDHHQLINAAGAGTLEERSAWEWRLPVEMRSWLFRFSLNRGYLDPLLERCIVRPFVGLFRRLDRFEAAMAARIEGGP